MSWVMYHLKNDKNYYLYSNGIIFDFSVRICIWISIKVILILYTIEYDLLK